MEEGKLRQRTREKALQGQPYSIDDLLLSQSGMLMMNWEHVFEGAFGTEQFLPKLLEFLQSGAINETPFNTIEASMYASLASKAAAGQKRPPNEGTLTDVRIVSTLLPYCDAMFVDNGCRAILLDIPREY